MLVPTILHILLRLLFRRSESLPPSKWSLAIYTITFIPTFLLTSYLQKIGTVKRDASGQLISSGEDLSQPGMTEWALDIIYITCMFYCTLKDFSLTGNDAGVCQVGSGALGEKVWYFWLIVSLVQRNSHSLLIFTT